MPLSAPVFLVFVVGIAPSSTWRSRGAQGRDVVSQAAALEPTACARWRTHHCACAYKVRRSACWLRTLGSQPRGGERKLRWVISVTNGLTWRLSAGVTLPRLSEQMSWWTLAFWTSGKQGVGFCCFRSSSSTSSSLMRLDSVSHGAY